MLCAVFEYFIRYPCPVFFLIIFLNRSDHDDDHNSPQSPKSSPFVPSLINHPLNYAQRNGEQSDACPGPKLLAEPRLGHLLRYGAGGWEGCPVMGSTHTTLLHAVSVVK